MIKIDLSPYILQRHETYFEDNVVKKMQDICSGEKDINEIIQKKTNGNSNKKTADNSIPPSVQKYLCRFLKFCLKNKKILSVGTMDKLKELKPTLTKYYKQLLRCNNRLADVIEYVFDYNAFANLSISTKKLLQGQKDVMDKNWCAYTFVISLGLRTCPYCNEQYITPTVTSEGHVRGDLDHFLPKSKYPFFALSIYNLIPCCKFCNSSLKGQKDFKESSTKTPYETSYNDHFRFDADIVGANSRKIKLVGGDHENNPVSEILKMFIIEARYNHHTDVIDDFLEKQACYNHYMLENIWREYSASELFDFLSLYYGYPKEKEQISDNVLGKLKRDLAIHLLKHDWLMH